MVRCAADGIAHCVAPLLFQILIQTNKQTNIHTYIHIKYINVRSMRAYVHTFAEFDRDEAPVCVRCGTTGGRLGLGFRVRGRSQNVHMVTVRLGLG